MKDKIKALKTKKAILAFMIIAIFIGLLSTIIVKTVNNKAYELTQEDLRAMNYTLVTEESAKVDGTENVLFNAYFLRDLDHDGYAEKYDGTCRSMSENAMLYMDVNVLAEGTLTNGKIQVNGQNFDFSMSMIADEVLKYNYLSSNVKSIELKDVNAGTQKLIFGKINPKIYNNINNYSVEENSITFTGTYIPLEGDPIEIEKTIDLTVDWYGITSATMVKNTKYDVLCDDIEDNTIQFNYEITETANQLILKDNSNIVKIPELCGYAPVEVKCLTEGVESNYNEDEKELTIFRESVVNENGIVNQSLARKNTYCISVKYPEEAYKAIVSFETLIFDIEGYYEGYNNPNEEFTNPYKSNVVRDNVQFIIRKEPKGEIFNFYVDYIDKKYISNPYCKYVISNQDIINAYNNFNDEIPAKKKFVVRWQAVRGSQGEVSSMIMSETKEEENYGDKWDSSLIEEYIENTGVYFIGADEILGEDGIITIYDNDTNEIIKEFTKEEWNNYTSSNPYTYDEPITHIRVETSKTNLNSKLEVYNIKELDTEAIINNYTLEELKEVGATYTYLTGICNIEGVGSLNINTADIAYFIHEKSRASISLEKRKAVVYEKLNNEKIYIDTIKYLNDDAKWKNGEFLVEVPAEILNMEINSVTCNNAGVTIEAYELYQDENGKYFIRIITKNEEAANYKITIDCNLVPDPRVATVNREFRLFAHNDYSDEYLVDIEDIYDVNLNNNKTEKVGYSTTNLFIAAPTSLITMETITDYDENTDSEITIAPNVALVNREERQAKININLTNNYTNAISDLRILGKIPYENNKYILTDKDLKSEFTTQITENGITIPNDLPNNIKNSTTIYYSENQNPTKDIENLENRWKTKENVEDWSKIVSYIICINDCKIAKGQSINFNYDVILPENVSLNKASYSTHAVYFDLNTEDGKIKLYTEPTKVGIRIVKKYILELNKFKLNSDLKIPDVTYLLKYNVQDDEGNIEEKQKILTTDENGQIVLSGLFATTEYILKEIKTPAECELNDEEITFIVDNDNVLTLTGNNRNYYYNNSKLQLDLENEITAQIQINKTLAETGTNIDNIMFSISDENGNKNFGSTIDGGLLLKGLVLGKTYTLKEINVPSTIRISNGIIKFKVYKDLDNIIKYELIENTLAEDIQFIHNDSTLCPTIVANIKNELRYSVNIKKEDEDGNSIKGAVFDITNLDNQVSYRIQTNLKGEASLNRLEVGNTYKINEIKSPNCYLDSNEENSVTFKVERGVNNKLNILNVSTQGGIILNSEPSIVEEGINAEVKFILENKKIPTYNLKLIKKNEYGETLAGAQFKIKSIDTQKEKLVTADENGEIQIDGLYEYVEGKYITGEYELTEIYAPEGYKVSDVTLRFKISRDNEDNLQFIGISGMEMIKENSETGDKEIITDQSTVTISILNKPIFNIIKYGEDNTFLPNAKFVVTDLEGNSVIGTDGRYVGVLENGKYVVITDENGKISASLPAGIYKAVEIEAPYGYDLPLDEANRTYYFGIDETKPAQYSDKVDDVDWINSIESSTTKMVSTDDGFLLLAGTESSYTITKHYLDENKQDVVFPFSCNSVYDFHRNIQGEILLVVMSKGETFEYDGNQTNITNDKFNYITVKLDDEGKCETILSYVPNFGIRTDVLDNGNIVSYREGCYQECNSIGEVVSTSEVAEPHSTYSANYSYSPSVFYGMYKRVKGKNGTLDLVKFKYSMCIDEDVFCGSMGGDGYALIYYDSEGNYKWKIDPMSSTGNSSLTYYPFSVYGDFKFDVKYDYEQETYICNICRGYNYSEYEYYILSIDEQGNLESFCNMLNCNKNYQNSQTMSYIKVKYYDENRELKNGYCLFERVSQNQNSNNDFLYKYVDSQGAKTINNSDKDSFEYIILTDENFNMIWHDEIYVKDFDGNHSYFESAPDGTYYLMGKMYNSIYAMGKNRILADSDNSLKSYLLKYGNGQIIPDIADLTEINVNNELKQYKITTEIAPNKYDERVGGTITGEYTDEYTPRNNIKYVESVKHGKDSEEEISINPDIDYIISKVTINGEEVPIVLDENGNMKLPSGYFKEIKENKHIVVSFVKKTQCFTIKKEDQNGNPLSGARFKITELRNSPTFEDLIPIGENKVTRDYTGDQTSLLGEMNNLDSEYYFIKNSNNSYVPNIQNASQSSFKGYFEVDLSDYSAENSYDLTVNITASNSSSWYDLIKVKVVTDLSDDSSTVTEKTEGGALSNRDITLTFSGNQKYYIIIDFQNWSGYYNFTLNSINLKQYNYITHSYSVEENDGVYQSNNMGVNSTYAESCIPIDLTNCTGTYLISFDYKIEGTSNDYGYIYLTESSDKVNTSSYTGRYVYKNGAVDDSSYKTTISGEKKYYLHIGYSNGSTNTDLADKITVWNILVEPYNLLIYTSGETDENGEILISLIDVGNYLIEEIETPEGYILDNRAREITITAENSNPTVTFVNYKASKVLVHHYLEGTGEENCNEPVVLADEVVIEGKAGDKYTTAPNMEIPKYTLVKKENGEYNIPENATGTFTDEEQHVYYYYNIKPISLVVHHYLEGTEDKLAEDELSTYDVGDYYKTNPSEDVLEEYELVQVVGDAENNITEDGEVIYYYVKKKHEITTRVETISYLGKSDKGGEITGEGEEPYETVKHGNSNIKEIVMTPNEGFKIEKVLINKLTNGEVISTEEVEDAQNLATSFELPQIDNIVNDYEIVVQYAPDIGKITVHHYIENTEIQIAPNEITIDDYGKVVKTSPVEPSKYDLVENSEKYILVESPENEEITIERQDKEVTYYYQAQYEITTEVVPYNKLKEDGTIERIKGGTVTGEEESPYEEVIKGNDSTKEIKIVPDEEYKIKFVRINGEKYDFKEKLAEDGSLTLDNFTNIDEDKHIEVEFRPILNPDLEIVVKHIEVNEKEIKAGLKIDSGKLLKQESFIGTEGNKIDIAREEFKDEITNRNYISVDGPNKEIMGYIIVVNQNDNKQNVEFVDVDNDEDDESDIIEVRFYYEKQYAITTEVKEHDEIVDEVTKKVKGGKISGEELEEYEIIGNKGNNEKEVIVEPDKGYKVKAILINGVEFDFEEYELDNHKVSIPKGYFKEISHDKHIIVEFEKIPAKVIIKHLEDGTNKELKVKEVKNGFVGDNYSSERAEIDGYETAGDEPLNAKGEMTENEIIIIYYYKKIEVIEEPEEPKEEETQSEEPKESKEELENSEVSEENEIIDEIYENGGIIEEIDTNKVISKQPNGGIKTGDDVIKYIVIDIICGVIFVVVIKRKMNLN